MCKQTRACPGFSFADKADGIRQMKKRIGKRDAGGEKRKF